MAKKQEEVAKSQPSETLTYPRSVYHKEYSAEKGDSYKGDPKQIMSFHEQYLAKYCKHVKSKEEHESLGPDWGA